MNLFSKFSNTGKKSSKAVQPGTSIGRYTILSELGQGGMAIVYRAYDTRLKKDVAVKLIRRTAFSDEMLEQMLARFDQEAASLARLTHPNIIQIIDFDHFHESPFLVMPYIPGGTLKRRIEEMILEKKSVTELQAGRLVVPIGRALAYAHQHGILHRDVKPANILITESGEPMLSDFGIARILDVEGNTLTGTGVGIGTPEYMAPEQSIGNTEPASDQYALGVILYELLTGRKLYTADTPIAVLIKHTHDPIPAARLINPEISKEAEEILFTALAKKPEQRFPTMDVFADMLERLIGQSLATKLIPAYGNTNIPTKKQDDISQPGLSEAQKDEPTEFGGGVGLVLQGEPLELKNDTTQVSITKPDIDDKDDIQERKASLRSDSQIFESEAAPLPVTLSTKDVLEKPIERKSTEYLAKASPSAPLSKKTKQMLGALIGLIFIFVFFVWFSTSEIDMKGSVKPEVLDAAATSEPRGGIPLEQPSVQVTITLSSLMVTTPTVTITEIPQNPTDLPATLVNTTATKEQVTPITIGEDEGEGPVFSVAYAQVSPVLAAGSSDNKVRVWNTNDGSLVATLEGHANIVNAVVFSPDGRTIATGGNDNLIKLWNVSDGSLITILRGHSLFISCLVFSPDGKMLASSSLDNSIRLWQVSDGKQLALKGHKNDVNSIAFFSDGTKLVSGSSDGTIRFWDVTNKDLNLSSEIFIQDERIQSVSLSPDNLLLVSGSEPWGSGSVGRVWRISDRSENATFKGRLIRFSLDGLTLIGVGEDNNIKIWDPVDGQLQKTVKTQGEYIYGIGLSPDGQTVAAGSNDHRIYLYSLNIND